MTSITEVAAWIGALSGSSALLWDVYKWRHRGAKLRVMVSGDMQTIGPLGVSNPQSPLISVEARNVGGQKTTVVNLVGLYYETRLQRTFRRKPTKQIVVANPEPGRLPHVLDVGERWIGMMNQNDVADLIREGYLYLGVTHSTGRAVVQRITIR